MELGVRVIKDRAFVDYLFDINLKLEHDSQGYFRGYFALDIDRIFRRESKLGEVTSSSHFWF